MSTGEERDTRSALAVSLDYKTLFVGACSVIVFLAGIAYQLWNHSNDREIESNKATLSDHAKRITELEAGQAELRFRQDYAEQDNARYKATVDTNSKTLNYVERFISRFEDRRK